LLEPGTLGIGLTRHGAKCRTVGFLAVGFRLMVKKERRWRRAHGLLSRRNGHVLANPTHGLSGSPVGLNKQIGRPSLVLCNTINQINHSVSTMPSPPRKKVPGPRLPADHENWYINVDGFMGRNWYALIPSLYCYVPHPPKGSYCYQYEGSLFRPYFR
jgi:hypothetical protein